MARPFEAPAPQGLREPLVVALSLFLTAFSVNLEMPLYEYYAKASGFGNGLSTLAFSMYVLGFIPAALALGGFAYRFGNRASLQAGLACALAATALMALAPPSMGLAALMAARVLQGAGVAISLGPGAAFLREILGRRVSGTGAIGLVSLTTSLGFGSGALVTGSFLLLRFDPTPPSYALAIALTAVCLGATFWLPAERGTQGRGQGRLFQPADFPPGALVPNLGIAVAWSVSGMIFSLLPSQLSVHGLSPWAGHALFAVTFAGALCQPVSRKLPQRVSLRVGCILLPIGYWLVVYGAGRGWIGVTLTGACLAGTACHGFLYAEGMARISRLAGARVSPALSGFLLCAYMGFALPSLFVGFCADRFGLFPSLAAFGIVLLPFCVFIPVADGLAANRRGS